MSAQKPPDERQPADHVATRKRALHALVDLAMMLTMGGTSIVWTAQGHGRDAFILAAICYWAVPWRERTDGR